MRRGVDTATTVAEALRQQRETTADLAQAQGRPPAALRDSAGNTLQMNPDAPFPLLRPVGVDGSMAFAPDGTVKIISPDTLEDRDLTARRALVDGVDATGHVGAKTVGSDEVGARAGRFAFVELRGVGANGKITGDNAGFNVIGVGRVNAGHVQLGNVKITGQEALFPGVHINTDFEGSVRAKNFYGGTFHGVLANSERRLKHEQGPVEDGLSIVLGLKPTRWRWRDPTVDTDAGEWPRTHVSIMADEVPAEGRVATKQFDPLTGQPVVDGAWGIEDRAIIAYLVDAVQTLTRELADLRRRVEGQPDATYPWEAAPDPPEPLQDPRM